MEAVYSNISIDIPTKDIDLAKTVVTRLGWKLRHVSSENDHILRQSNRTKALEELRMCVSLPDGFDYKEEVSNYLERKYNFKG